MRYNKGLCGPFSIKCQSRWWCIIDWACGKLTCHQKKNIFLTSRLHHCVREVKFIIAGYKTWICARKSIDLLSKRAHFEAASHRHPWLLECEANGISVVHKIFASTTDIFFDDFSSTSSYRFQSRFIAIFDSHCYVTRLTGNFQQ